MADLVLCRRYVDGMIAHPVTGEPVAVDPAEGRVVPCASCGRDLWCGNGNDPALVAVCEAHLDDDNWPPPIAETSDV